MQYNEDEMQNLEVADQFYNMIVHIVEQIFDTIAEVEPEITEQSTTHNGRDPPLCTSFTNSTCYSNHTCR